MRNYIGYIIDYSDRNLTDRKRRWFESELMHNETLRKEYNLFKQVNDYMRGKYDVDEILNDPNKNNIDTLASQMVSDFHENPNRFEEATDFVQNSLANIIYDLELENDLNKISEEANNLNVNELTESWVKDWTVKNQNNDPETISRRAFISSSLNNDDLSIDSPKVKRNYSLAIRIAGFAAAALIATFLVINTLIPSNTPENLYKEYYSPLNANVDVTRSNTNIVDPFSRAIEKYKQGQYQVAGTMFSDLMFEDPENIAYHFFSGITQIELGDYEQSIILLNEVIANNGDYKKEAQWYLALVYLKMGDIQKATSFINDLAQSQGNYKTKAQNLLNRLE